MKTKTGMTSLLMKKLFCTIVLASVLAAQAQTNPPAPPAPSTPPASVGSFFQTAQSYFTSFNTNLDSTFLSRGEIAVGVDSIQGGGANLANSVRVSYNTYKSISLELQVRDTGVSGVFIGEEFGPALNFVIHDAKLTLFGHLGLNNANDATKTDRRIYGEIGVRAQKALTEHTFAGIGMGIQLPDQQRTFTIFTGFTF